MDYPSPAVTMPRPLSEALFYETDGDLNVSSLVLLLMGLTGAAGFVWAVILSVIFGHPSSITIQLAAWSWLAGFSASVLLAAIPVAKSKILARATLPADLSQTIATMNVETSTDMMEQGGASASFGQG